VDTSDLTPDILADLRRPRRYPAITLAMPTDPDLPFGEKDRILVRDLVVQARRQLADDPGVPRDVRLELRDRVLDPEVIADAGAPFHPAGAMVVHLAAGEPVQVWQLTSPAVEPRVEFATSFLTRYAVAAEQRSRPYLVLVLGQEMCRLYHGAGRELAEVRRHGFPQPPRIPSPEDSLPGPIPHAPPYEGHDERVRQYLRTVDGRLASVLGEHPGLPLFVIGSEKALSVFTGLTAQRGRVTGTSALTGMDKDTPPELVKRLEPLLEDFRTRQVAEALEDLGTARGGGRYAGGAPEVWTAAADKRVQLLLVEESLAVAGRIGRDGRVLTTVPYPEPVTLPDPRRDAHRPAGAVGLATDVVEQLVENAVEAGSQVLFVPDDTLAEAGRVAAVLRF
jgi:hypothetical protein